MKVKIKNRFSGDIRFEATIKCKKSTPGHVLIGKAIKWAIENKVSLVGANLSGAKLTKADLSGIDLTGADLSYTIIDDVDLTGANLTKAKLAGANLNKANLTCAFLTGANLLVFQADRYTTYVGPVFTRVGCQYHLNKKWKSFADKEINSMAEDALGWWDKYKSIVFAMMDTLDREYCYN